MLYLLDNLFCLITNGNANIIILIEHFQLTLYNRLTSYFHQCLCCPNTKSSAHSCTTDYNANIIVSHNHVSF